MTETMKGRPELEAKIKIVPIQPENLKNQRFIKWRYNRDTKELEIMPSTTVFTGGKRWSIGGTFDNNNKQVDLGRSGLTPDEATTIETAIANFLNQ